MGKLNKKQAVQDQEYSFPYHYIPQGKQGFSQNIYWSWGINYQATLDFLVQEIKKDKPESIVDIGTGDGRLVKELSHSFPGKKILGVDYSGRAINLAKALNPGLQFVKANIITQPFKSKFQAATLIEVLEHIPKNQVDQFVKAIHDLLTPGGHLFLTVPHQNMPLQKKHVQHFNLKVLKKYLSPYFSVKRVKFLGKQSWQYQLVLLLLGNPFFILNHTGLKNALFGFYKKKLFITQENNCSRIYLKLVKK